MSAATQRPFRRVVVVDENDKSKVVSDGVPLQVTTDPARPGYRSALLWMTDRSPARIQGQLETVGSGTDLRAPPKGGSLCRVVDFPPEPRDSRQAHLEKTGSLDFCFVIEGEITLVLDVEEVTLKAGDIVVQRGTNHAWSNRSGAPCRVVFTQHDAVYRP